MIKVITSKNDWNSSLRLIENYDFYHTYDYHNLSKTSAQKPVLLKYQVDEVIVLFPLLIQEIEDANFVDATSVYGYAGPLCEVIIGKGGGSQGVTQGVTPDLIRDFQTELDKSLKELGLVSVFSRLNPYIESQLALLDGLGQVKAAGNIVYIDLSKPVDTQRSGYRKSTRSLVNKARKTFSVRVSENEDELTEFVSIYHETMQKLSADEMYYFDESYFIDLYQSSDFKTEILSAISNEKNEIAAASMFIQTKNIVQYHLSGTRSEYSRLSPSRLLLDEMRLRATAGKFTYFNLGGGYNSRRDALYDFKSAFSKDNKEFCVWRYVVDQQACDQILADRGLTTETDYFPPYRQKPAQKLV